MENRILIISPAPGDVGSLRHALGNASDGPFVVEDAATLADGLHRIAQGGIDAILLDMCLPDSSGLASFDQVFAAARHTPIMALCALAQEQQAREAVQRGAQGWLSKGYFDNNLVPQSLRNIIERMRVERREREPLHRSFPRLEQLGGADHLRDRRVLDDVDEQ